jgi:hypothetical protein
MGITFPPEVDVTLSEFRTCEFSTISKAGVPVAWPVSTRFLPTQGCFLLTTSLGLPQKAYNIRRNPRVSMLFSNPTGSGLTSPAAVLIQGDAVTSDEVYTSPVAVEGLREYWLETIYRRQPGTAFISENPLMRKMMDWYYMRILIYVTPRVITWWPGGDFSRPANRMEVQHVG